MKENYYSLNDILSKNADYNIIIGERSNGKTYAVLKRILEKYHEKDIQGAIVRRWADDFKGKRGASMFDALVANNEVTKITKGLWNDVYYFSSRWYLCKYDEEGNRTLDDKPFCFGFALTGMEHDKGTSFPGVGIILFDEFITRSAYLPDEFVLMCNTISSIIRHRDTCHGEPIKIFMCGNTVNRYCPYFDEMGLTHVKNQEQGTIDIYAYGEKTLSGKPSLKVAVEYCTPASKKGNGKNSDKFFAFDNPKLQMITGGAWEIDIYPHCPCKIRPKDVLFKYYIKFDSELLECRIIKHDEMLFTFVNKKTTPLKEEKTDLIYSTDFDPRPNYYRNITRPKTQICLKIADFYIKDKIFYDSNETGEIMRNYLIWCGKERG